MRRHGWVGEEQAWQLVLESLRVVAVDMAGGGGKLSAQREAGVQHPGAQRGYHIRMRGMRGR